MHAITAARVHITHSIRVNAIRKPIIAVREDLPVIQSLAVLRDVKSVDSRRVRSVVFPRERMHASVGHVDMLVVRSELNAIRSVEVVRYRLHHTRVRLKPVHLLSDRWCGIEVLPVSVLGVREPEITSVRVLLDVVDGGEVAAEEVVEKHATAVRRWVHKDKLGRVVIEVAFVAEDDLLACAAVRWRAHWVKSGSTVRFSEVIVPDRLYGIVVMDVDSRDVHLQTGVSANVSDTRKVFDRGYTHWIV